MTIRSVILVVCASLGLCAQLAYALPAPDSTELEGTVQQDDDAHTLCLQKCDRQANKCNFVAATDTCFDTAASCLTQPIMFEKCREEVSACMDLLVRGATKKCTFEKANCILGC
jgi:hypothetical protein